MKQQLEASSPNDDDNDDENNCQAEVDAKEEECNQTVESAQQDCRGVLTCCISQSEACPTSKVQEFIDNFLVGKSG